MTMHRVRSEKVSSTSGRLQQTINRFTVLPMMMPRLLLYCWRILLLPNMHVMITLTVTDINGTMDSDTETFLHVPSSGSAVTDLGFLVTSTTNLQIGDEVSVRAIGHDGTERYYPSPPLVVDASSNGAWNWPVALRQAIGSAAPIEVGV